MKREIKFRAWLPVGEWSEDGESQVYEMVGPDALAFEGYEPLADHLKSCENLMQFTGLKDKNGREIFEGDILERDTMRCLVGWDEKLASFVLKRNGWMYDHYFQEGVVPEKWEIIGNKYENPELLEAK